MKIGFYKFNKKYNDGVTMFKEYTTEPSRSQILSDYEDWSDEVDPHLNYSKFAIRKEV